MGGDGGPPILDIKACPPHTKILESPPTDTFVAPLRKFFLRALRAICQDLFIILRNKIYLDICVVNLPKCNSYLRFLLFY